MPKLNSTQILQLEQSFLVEISKWRKAHRLPGLKTNTRLQQLAKRYSQDMAQRKFFSHYDPNGRDLSDRVLAAGINYQEIGENLAKTTNQVPSPNEVLCGWLLSSGHRKNIENKRFIETGLGIAYSDNEYYITQIFLRPPLENKKNTIKP